MSQQQREQGRYNERRAAQQSRGARGVDATHAWPRTGEGEGLTGGRGWRWALRWKWAGYGEEEVGRAQGNKAVFNLFEYLQKT
jgi:hypothetical protein